MTRSIASTKNTYIAVKDAPGSSGANHEYDVVTYPKEGRLGLVASLSFQNGPIAVVDINGCNNEDLLVILIDRLKGFQSGPYACKENDLALLDLEHCLEMLNTRTRKREERGVEGTHTI